MPSKLEARIGPGYIITFSPTPFCPRWFCPLNCRRAFAAVSALASGQLVRARARGVDPEQPNEVYGFYMFLWKIFYASYLVLPLAR